MSLDELGHLETAEFRRAAKVLRFHHRCAATEHGEGHAQAKASLQCGLNRPSSMLHQKSSLTGRHPDNNVQRPRYWEF
ncbi:MAG: hypothetical protein C0487_04300 [Leptothrix sp. (in: Bacteria)]|nr:hypothetical protein [Leptothrix sp. (in: b-proteobacteria)]